MVKKLKEQLLAKAAELGWSNISTDKAAVKLELCTCSVPYTITANPNKLLEEVSAQANIFNTTEFVKNQLISECQSMTVEKLLEAANNISESLIMLRKAFQQVAHDFDNYISGMALSRLLVDYTSENRFELWTAINESRSVRRKKEGTGHATRWWFHKEDVIKFCERHCSGGVLTAPPTSKLNGLYVFVGPSGVGKSTIMKKLKQVCGFNPLQTCTDRQPHEENEAGHIFVSEMEFKTLLSNGKVIAQAEYAGHNYGILTDTLDAADMTALEISGIPALYSYCQKQNRPVHIIGLAASKDSLRDRMRRRGSSDYEILTRLNSDSRAFDGMCAHCDVVIKNEDLDGTVAIIRALISNWERKDCEQAKKEPSSELNSTEKSLYFFENGDVDYIKNSVKVSLFNAGEGKFGDYDANDPDDVNLLRFSVFVRDEDGLDLWTEVDGASYCTNIPASILKHEREQAVSYIMDTVYDRLTTNPYGSIKRTCEKLSRLDEDICVPF